jgi:hypothetical protein
MDFLLEHESDPVPDPSSAQADTSVAGATTRRENDAMDEDDDEDRQALASVYGGNSAAAAADVEAKVTVVDFI